MKCTACGYEKRTSTHLTADVVRYKSGKKKGEIKNITERFTEPDKDKPAFKQITSEHGGYFELQDGYNTFYVRIYMCPECQTLRVE